MDNFTMYIDDASEVATTWTSSERHCYARPVFYV